MLAMPLSIPCLLLLAAMTAPSGAGGPGRSGAAEPGTAELERLETAWNEAHLRGDAQTLDELWSDDLMLVVPGMQVMGKPEAIGIWRRGGIAFQRYETTGVTIRVIGEAAVVTGRLERTRLMGDREAHDDWRFTKVYARRDGRWRVILFHASESPGARSGP